MYFFSRLLFAAFSAAHMLYLFGALPTEGRTEYSILALGILALGLMTNTPKD